MKFKYLVYKNIYGEEIVFGKKDKSTDSTWQLQTVTGIGKNTIRIFKNETINSQQRIFRGNRLPERNITIKVTYQPKESILPHTKNKWEKKEDDLVSLINKLQTTDLQTNDNTGILTFFTRNGKQYYTKNVIVESITPSDSGNAYNNFTSIKISFRIYDPFIYDGSQNSVETFDFSLANVLTDFVNDEITDSRLGLELEANIEKGVKIVEAVRDGYISNDGIFYAVDTYGEDTDITKNGQFWLTSSLEKSVINNGARTYPIFTIYGFAEKPIIDNNTTGVIFELDYTIQDNQSVEINMNKKTCELVYTDAQGNEQKEDLRGFISQDSQWLYLDHGANEINISATSASQENFKVDLNWEIAYEGISI